MASRIRKRSVRQRIADWPPLTDAVGSMLAGYLRFVHATSRCEKDGLDAVRAAIAEHGSVIFVFWHQRSFATPYIYNTNEAPVGGLNADSRPGQVARAILRRFDYETTPMPKGRKGMGAMRKVLAGLSNGVSIGIAVDGPRGPARQSKAYPVQWSRASGKPIFIFAYAARSHVKWPSWDRLILPLPFTRLTFLWREWRSEIPRRPSEDQMAALIEDLNASLDQVTDEADARTSGHSTAHG